MIKIEKCALASGNFSALFWSDPPLKFPNAYIINAERLWVMMRRSASVLIFVAVLALAAIPFALAPEPNGVAVLYVYEDAAYTTLKGLDAQGRYSVLPGETIYVHLDNINDISSSLWSAVELRWGTPDGSIPVPDSPFTKKSPDPFHAGMEPYVGDASQVIDWVVGDADGDLDVDYVWPESTTIILQYKFVAAVGADVPSNWFVASGPVTTRGHLHVVPEMAFGVAGITAVAIAAFAIFAARRRR